MISDYLSTQPTLFKTSETLQILTYTLRKSLQTLSALSATSKQCFEQPAASFLVCTLIFIEHQIPPATQQVSLNPGQIFQCLT